MRYDLKRPCLHCPFRPGETRIVFACRERAEEIEESAYRNGFPCHNTAEWLEDEEAPKGMGGAYAKPDSQHCAGAIMMYLAGGEYCWPGIDNDEDLAETLNMQMDWDAPHFADTDEFLDANTPEPRP